MQNIDVKVYVASPMSGYEKDEMVARAQRVCDILHEEGITPISPVIEEKVKNEPGKLINSDKDRLHTFWDRDKEILIEEAHVMLWDHAERKSFGCEREMGLMRFCLWKPTVIYVAQGTPTSVAEFEDDFVTTSIHEAAKFIVANYGTRIQRVAWRIRMLKRTLPKWLKRQLKAWK